MAVAHFSRLCYTPLVLINSVMCGIFAYLGPNEKAAEIVLKGLKKLEYRGYDSWGIAAQMEGGDFVIEKHV